MSDVGTTARKLTTRDKLRIWERDKATCQGCQRQLHAGDKWICEHVRALELGGSNDDANLAVYCFGCASEKTKDDHAQAAKAKRAKAAHINAKTAPAKPIQSAPFAKSEKTKVTRAFVPPRPLYRDA